MIRIALYQPEIAGNVGAFMRLCACMGVPLDIIEPCGFPWNERKIRASALDYYDHAQIKRHKSWDDFNTHHHGRRIIIMTTKSDRPYTGFNFQNNDILLAGSESSGIPVNIHKALEHKVGIPMKNNMRSLNVATASAMILGEAIRQVSHE